MVEYPPIVTTTALPKLVEKLLRIRWISGDKSHYRGRVPQN
jgi:hypothetical protein